MGVKAKRRDLKLNHGEEEEETGKNALSKTGGQAKEHIEQLQRLQQKDPEFFEFLKEHDKELLEFNDEDIDEDADDDLEDADNDVEDAELHENYKNYEPVVSEKEETPSKKAVTAEMVDSWCHSIEENGKLVALRSLMKAFRTACHYGDDNGDDPSTKFSTMSSTVFNKIMLFVLSKMDGILRKFLKLPSTGGKKEIIQELMTTKKWKSFNHIVKSYLGNALHILNQMTDTEMISFTLRCLKYSSIFLVAFPSLQRKYIKVALHFWGTGGGALPVTSFLFLRDLCIRLGSDCLDECYKGMYKAYVLNCQFVNATKLQHIQFLGNCVIELFRVDLSVAYQHAFLFIRQLAMILREALNTRTKEAFRKVYEWKYINCLELWTGAVCAYGSEVDFKPLAYPLAQIISGVARLVPTARYFPLRLRCIKMLNRIAASIGTFIPVSMLLLDMLEMKELNRPPTGGIGKAVDLRTILKVSKPTLKTRAFQEACVFSVIEELAGHLSQWSYSASFFELSFIPVVRLRNFSKSTKVQRFQKEIRQLIRQVEANSEFTNERRNSISFLPNDPAVSSFLEDEKKLGASPLSKYVSTLRQRARQQTDSLSKSSVLYGEHSSVFGKSGSDSEDEDTEGREGTSVFSSTWLPGSSSKEKHPEEKKSKKKKRKMEQQDKAAPRDEDVVEDLVLSSDEDDGPLSDTSAESDGNEDIEPVRKQTRKPKAPSRGLKKIRSPGNKAKKRKTSR
ncbi:nucleolar complex protein 2 homolog [Benincasa hispida]|uniref:nucleolar complex protein 2 homolog n=1 Tax=Benincasa hispida TaxID=102211 RepID=UPI0019015549|nr:nucleolar complex protein 2 homolog [Benincasa hispida]XP_038885122.1 nucleolar complex protein 2 homolog [Benincasa hispida]XP_038885123.1 nucleolar complex protein 2 homolog [Benincasa hispida]